MVNRKSKSDDKRKRFRQTEYSSYYLTNSDEAANRVQKRHQKQNFLCKVEITSIAVGYKIN